MGLGKEEHKSKVSFSSYHMEHTGAYCQHELSLLYGPWSYGRGRVCRRLKLLPFCTALFGRKSLCTAHTWVGSYARPPWGCCLGINYLRVFFTGDFSLFPCLFDHLYQYGFMAVYFILCITAQRYFILLLRLSQLWLLRVLSFGPCVPLTYPVVVFCLGLFLSASLLSGTTRCPRLILCPSCPSPGFSCFSKGAFYWRMVIRAQDLDV